MFSENCHGVERKCDANSNAVFLMDEYRRIAVHAVKVISKRMVSLVILEPSSLGNVFEEVIHPCNPNPCPSNHLCEVNRKGCHATQDCLPYLCVQGNVYVCVCVCVCVREYL